MKISFVKSHTSMYLGKFLLLPLTLLLSGALLSSCGVGIGMRSLFGETLDMEIQVDEVANNEYPLAMEVVYVYDEGLFQSLQSMPASEWFKKRKQIANDFPGTSGFESWQWELIAGDSKTVHIPLRAGTVGGFVFVNYFSEGDHRIRLDLFRDFKLHLTFDAVIAQAM